MRAFQCVLLLMPFFSSTGLAAPATLTATCPDAGNQLRVDVITQVSFDETAKLYRYDYTITNNRMSAQDLRLFALEVGSENGSFESPRGWHGAHFYETRYIGWQAVDFAPDVRMGTMPKARNQVQPGQQASGFVLISPLPPGNIRYRAVGWVDHPPGNKKVRQALSDQVGDSVASEIWQEEMQMQCSHLAVPELLRGITGTTVGPTEELAAVISPLRAGIPPNPLRQDLLFIQGSKTVDARQIVLDSLSVDGEPIVQTGLLPPQDFSGDAIQDMAIAWKPGAETLKDCARVSALISGKMINGRSFSGSVDLGNSQCPNLPKLVEITVQP